MKTIHPEKRLSELGYPLSKAQNGRHSDEPSGLE